VTETRYVVRPSTDRDLDDQAYFYPTEANPEIAHRFLVSAHDTFALLATQPNMGWPFRIKHPELKSLRVFRVCVD
jgi:plasmid stabilization system protein ParE